MNKELTEKLLSMYRDIEGGKKMRYFMPLEWNDKKWCAATDGHQFILIPENNENKLEKPPIETVNIAGIMPVFDWCVNVPIESIKDAYESIELIKEEITTECQACDGEGTFEHDGYDYDCKSCDEKGYIGTGKFEMIKNPDVVIRIGIANYANRFIKTLIDVCNITNCQRLEIRSQRDYGLTIFELGNQIIIGLMSKSELEKGVKIVEATLLACQ